MKYIVLCFFFVCSINAQAQGSLKKELSFSELQRAKKAYIQMMESETYLSLRQNNRMITIKSNGAKLFDMDELIAMDKDSILSGKEYNHAEVMAFYEGYFRKKMIENIEKTKFSSVEEGVAVNMKSVELTKKKMDENAELYALMFKASLSQIREITAPEKLNFYDDLYEHSKN